MKYKVTSINSNNETKIIKSFENYKVKVALFFLQELIKALHSNAKVKLTENQAKVVTEIGIEINYKIIEERI